MFQVMVQTSGYDFSDINMEDYPKVTVNGSPKGQLGTSLPMDTLIDNDIDIQSLGSVNFKFFYLTKTVSVLAFNKGNIKISGGLPNTSKSDIEDYLMNLSKTLCKIFNAQFLSLDIKLLNGQITLPPFKDTTYLKQFVHNKSSFFEYIKSPCYDRAGRRPAYKLYLKKDRKTHCAVDCGGKLQIFAAKSLDELFYFRELFKN